jgi:hypothetical protein
MTTCSHQKLIEAEILKSYDGELVDGFPDTGFAEEHLERRYGRDFGYYLHLHGTPLYIDSGELIIKQKQGHAEEVSTKHLVLTHVRHKRSVIDASPVLRAYWRHLDLALQESQRVILLGYSGLDEHLNHRIRVHASGKTVLVIEWTGTGKSKRVLVSGNKSFPRQLLSSKWKTYWTSAIGEVQVPNSMPERCQKIGLDPKDKLAKHYHERTSITPAQAGI